MTKFKLIKKITKKWTSGITIFAIIGDSEHPDRNYIVLERTLAGKPEKNQKFNLHLSDWNKLKELIESDTAEDHNWPIQEKITEETTLIQSLEEVLKENPDFWEKILSNKNIAKLSKASFESLDKLAIRIYEIKTENIDFLLKQLSEAKDDELENFISLLNELRIGQISTIVELVKKKISIIKFLEKLIAEEETKEKEIHELLKRNLWLLDNNYDLVRSDKPLSDYLDKNIGEDPELRKRPDLIIKMFLQDPHHIILVELKRPSVKLKPEHIGQVMKYKGIIQKHNPNIKIIDIFLLGYDIDSTMPTGLSDLKVEVLENIVNKKKIEFDEFLKIINENQEGEYDIF